MQEKNRILLILQMVFIVLSLAIQVFKEKFFSYALFWIFFLGVVLSGFFLMLQKKNTHKFLSLIALDIFIIALFSFNFPLFYQVDRDVAFETQTAERLITEKYWNPSGGNGYAEDYYGYNPTIHIISAFTSILSGYPVTFLAKHVLIYVLSTVFLSAVIILLLNFFREPYSDIAYLTGFFYVITPRLRILAISRRLAAAIFVVLCLILLIKSMKKKDIKYDFAFMVFSFMVVISDHSMSFFMFLFLFAGLFSYLIIYPMLKFLLRFSYKNFSLVFLKLTLFHGLSIFIWEYLIARKLWNANLNYIDKLFGFLNPDVAQTVSTAARNLPYLYSSFETILIYGSQLLIIIITAFIFIKFFKFFQSKTYHDGYVFDFWFLMFFLVFSVLGYIFSVLLARTEWATLTNVFIWFPLIGISMMFSFIISSLNIGKKKISLNLAIAVLFVSFFFIGCLLINYHPNVLYPKKDTETIMELKQYKNPYLYESGKWLYENSKNDKVIIGDRAVFDIYSGYFYFDQAIIPLTYRLYYSNFSAYERQFLRWSIWTGSYEEKMRQQKLNYIIINEDVFFEKSYLFGDPVPYEHIHKFENSNKTIRIYDNGKISIYYNIWGKIV